MSSKTTDLCPPARRERTMTTDDNLKCWRCDVHYTGEVVAITNVKGWVKPLCEEHARLAMVAGWNPVDIDSPRGRELLATGQRKGGDDE
jgi:hypothetical protein